VPYCFQLSVGDPDGTPGGQRGHPGARDPACFGRGDCLLRSAGVSIPKPLLVVSGLGIAAFHVYLVQTDKLECPPALFGWGDGPLQSLLIFTSLTLVCLAGAWTARRPERGGGFATVVAVSVLGCITAWACIASAPPLPPAPQQPYDAVKQPFNMCRPPFPGP
jgi:hypothetical protein